MITINIDTKPLLGKLEGTKQPLKMGVFSDDSHLHFNEKEIVVKK